MEMKHSPFSINNEELKNSVQTLLLLHVNSSKISELIAEAYKNTPKKWQEEIFYLLNNKIQNEEARKEYLVKELDKHLLDNLKESQIWQKIDKLSFEEKLPYLLCHILSWNNERISKLLNISISEVEIFFGRILKKLES